jgi:hypothetical protein
MSNANTPSRQQTQSNTQRGRAQQGVAVNGVSNATGDRYPHPPRVPASADNADPHRHGAFAWRGKGYPPA